MAYAVPSTYTLDKPILQALTASSTTQEHDLGYTVRSVDGREFVYVEMASDNVVAEAGGYPAYWMSGTSTNYVTNDVSDAQEVDGTDGPIGNAFAGVITNALAAAHGTTCFMWIQTKGFVPDASLSTSVAAQEGLVAKSDNYLDTYSTASESSSHIIAYALEADVSCIGNIMLLGNS